MKKVIFGLALGAVIALNACNNSEKKDKNANDHLTTEQLAGFKMVEQNCYVCHSPTASEASRIAPPLEAVKRHYLDGRNITEDQFVKEITAFVKQPSTEKSLMPGAVNRFGLMQSMPFSESQLDKMARAIYHAELPVPDWFEEHYNEEREKRGFSETTSVSDLQAGKKIALQTKGVLGGNLMTSIQEKGTEGALEFCSTKAIPLTDSMSTALHASIKRVSDKNRNPNNVANEAELAYIKHAKEQLKNGEDIMPKLSEVNGRNLGYYPIMTKAMCLQCHGQKDIQIKAATLEKIQDLYPNDKATGYGENELRGIWVVEFDKQQKES